ncbi:MAG: hypothetical protein KAW92_05955 [Candidatus Cloacimonetes bacterium]|nr:hypothetical protein [Candidatus Cloacimonadota bacterium]
MIFFILAIISATLVFFYYRKTNPHISTSLKWILGVIRFLFFFIVLILLITPILHFHKRKKQHPFSAIALDISGSMNQMLDNGETKISISKKFISKLEDFHNKKDINYKIYNFSNGLEDDTLRTDIFLSLNQIQKKEKDQNLSDIILISDGLNHNNNNFPILKEINIPVSVVILGENPQYADISIKDIITNNPVYLNTETEIKTIVESNQDNQNIIIKLWDEDRLVSTKKFPNIQKVDELLLSYKPVSIGFKKMRVSVELEQGYESNLLNNQREFLLNVVKDRVKILILTSQLNWDATFIHRVLKQNEKFTVNLVEKRKDGYYFENDNISVFDFLIQSDLLIMHNRNKFNLTDKEYNEIRDFVKRGGNLIYIDRIDKKLSDLLPLVESKYKEEINTNILLTSNADNYQTFSIIRNGKEMRKLWQELPPIYANFYSPKKNVEILAIADLSTQNPVIVLSSYFNGNVLMFAGNDFYRWKMWEDIENEWFDEFFNSIVNWFINTDIRKRFLCTTNKLQYMEGEPVDFSALIFDEKMNTISRQDILLKIKKADEIIEKYLTEKNNKYITTIDGLGKGKYNFQAECVLGNNLITSKGEFLIESIPLEESSTGINKSFLTFIASQTDGKIIETEEDFEQLLTLQREQKQVISTNELELWKKWYIPVIAIFLISLELFIRKRKGLL